MVDSTGTVQQFVSFSNSITATEGPAAGMTATQLGDLTAFGESMETTDGGLTYSMQSAPNAGTIACYAAGTLIDTPGGPRRIESLQAGDLVETLDHGPQPVRWTRQGEQPLQNADPDATPVLIKAGSLGEAQPTQDLVVSPQHRVFVGGEGQLQDVFDAVAFAPAKSLTGLPGIRHMRGRRSVVWCHFACAGHEVVRANGCWSESLLLGPMVVQGLTNPERAALRRLFGVDFADGPRDKPFNGPAARPCLRVGSVRRLVKAHRKAGILPPGIGKAPAAPAANAYRPH